jgi:hypothetical protein
MNSISEMRVLNLRPISLNEMRHLYFMRVSAQLVFLTGIKQRLLPQLVTSHVK